VRIVLAAILQPYPEHSVIKANKIICTTASCKMITVICPVFNEAAYIKSVLEFFVNALPADKELILIDGASTDATCNIINKYQEKYSNIHLLHNPDRYVPYALNKAIVAAKGDIIVRLDAHTNYDIHYFEKIMETFDKTGADIVGGAMRIADGNNIQNAIGYATTTKFGVGNSSFHFEHFEGYTDSVYLGAWRKNIFNKTGLFDTTFKRNQDDEFHYRAKSMGFKVYQSRDIKLYYHPRKNLKLLFKQYYQYGLYKPLVLKKIKSAANLRHLIPSFFVIYLLLLPLFALNRFYAGFIPLAVYLFAAITFAVFSKRPLKETILIPAVYLTLHVAYGLGFLVGLSLKSTKTEEQKQLAVTNNLKQV
jgi:glycosyltransferase involved in cell wall biosynthesis